MASLEQKLWEACLDGELVAVNDAIRKGADLNLKNKQLYTSLHAATDSGHDQIVQVLLEHGADPNTVSEDEYTPLMTACARKSRNCVILLLEHDANPDLEDTAEGALHVAVTCGNKEIAKLLLNANAIVDKRNKEEETPLHIAAKNGDTEMICYLISKKAKINAKSKIGYTALHYAAIHSHPAVVELLLDKGAKPDTVSKNGYSPLISAAKSGSREIVQQLIQWSSPQGKKIDLFQDGPDGNSALHFASDQAQLEVVKLLVVKGNLNKLNQDGDAPLHLASRKGHVPIVQLLVKHGARQWIKNKEGKTPKQLAKENNHQMTEAILNTKPLLSKHRSLKQEDSQPCAQSDDEVLWNACYENDEDQIRKILSQGANPNWRNTEFNSFSCLDIAVYRNHTEAEKILLENVESIKESALHLAASYGCAEAAESLISAGVDVDAIDKSTNNTPLHNAAAYGHLDTVKLLVQRRASLKKRNNDQLTPLDVAKKRKQFDVMKFLEESESASSPSNSKTAAEYEAAWKAEMEKRKEVEAELKQLKKELGSKATSIQSADTCSPQMKDLIKLELNNGSSVRVIDAIVAHSESQCEDFAQLLLKNPVKVKGLTESCKEDKEKFVRAVLRSWTSNTDRSWRDLMEAMSGAALDEETVKLLQETFT